MAAKIVKEKRIGYIELDKGEYKKAFIEFVNDGLIVSDNKKALKLAIKEAKEFNDMSCTPYEIIIREIKL